MKAISEIRVECRWDADASVWYVEDSNVPGLVAGAPSIDAMEAKLQSLVPELLILNGIKTMTTDHDLPLHVIATQSSRLRLAS